MEKTLRIKRNFTEIEISDLDEDNEVEMTVTDMAAAATFWLDKEDLILIKEHIDYLVSKSKS